MNGTRADALFWGVYVNICMEHGNIWSRDVNQLSQSDLTKLAEVAKVFGYKKPELHSIGYGFFMYIQGLADKYEWAAYFDVFVKDRTK